VDSIYNISETAVVFLSPLWDVWQSDVFEYRGVSGEGEKFM